MNGSQSALVGTRAFDRRATIAPGRSPAVPLPCVEQRGAFEMVEKPVRRCGDCQLCCKLLPMRADGNARAQALALDMVAAGLERPESFAGMVWDFDKPAGAACPHQCAGKGCRIYATRPLGCRYWNCKWLMGDDTGELRRPDRSRYVIDAIPDFIMLEFEDGSPPQDIPVVQIWVDPKVPQAWRDPALLAYLERRGTQGIAALIRFNAREGMTVFPPSMASDGQWHEQGGQSLGRERGLSEMLAAVRKAAALAGDKEPGP